MKELQFLSKIVANIQSVHKVTIYFVENGIFLIVSYYIDSI